jgi:hypothetical protein
MTIVEPIPDLQWGRGAWQDYISNWRTRDTSWMQERLILRYQTAAARTADWGASPRAGQVTYNDESKTLEMWHSVKASWVRSLMFQYATSVKDDATGVNISHISAGGKGATFGPSSVIVDTALSVGPGVLGVDLTGVTIKTGTKTAKLTTSATDLVSDSPITAAGLASLGDASVTGTLAVGGFQSPSATITNITMAGTLSGGVLNGSVSGLIGGVGLSGGTVSSGAGATGGMQTGQGHFYGDANSAVMRQRPAVGGAWGTAYVQATATDVNLNGSLISLLAQPRVQSSRSMQYATGAGVFNGGPVIVQAGDPGVGNVPEGTIWIQA